MSLVKPQKRYWRECWDYKEATGEIARIKASSYTANATDKNATRLGNFILFLAFIIIIKTAATFWFLFCF